MSAIVSMAMRPKSAVFASTASSDGLKRIAKDLTANANRHLVEHAYRMGYLYGEKE